MNCPTCRRRARVAPLEPLCTAADVARVLQVSVAEVYRLIESGALEASRVGDSVRIRQSAVQALLRRGLLPRVGGAA